jgi:hypothetical protein
MLAYVLCQNHQSGIGFFGPLPKKDTPTTQIASAGLPNILCQLLANPMALMNQNSLKN